MVYLGIVVGCDIFYNCSYCLFLMVYRIFIYFRIVFCIYFSVVFMVSGGVYLDICAYFFLASRAFSIYIWRASMSSDVSIPNSSSCGSTMMVTDFAIGWNSVNGFCCDVVVACTSVLVDGISFAFPTFARSITLWSVTVGCYYSY